MPEWDSGDRFSVCAVVTDISGIVDVVLVMVRVELRQGGTEAS